MTISESQLMDLSARREAMQDEVINRLMERVDALNEQLRILREENDRLKAERVKVVRCKDCVWAYVDERGDKFCDRIDNYAHDDFFCGCGERKENAGK